MGEGDVYLRVHPLTNSEMSAGTHATSTAKMIAPFSICPLCIHPKKHASNVYACVYSRKALTNTIQFYNWGDGHAYYSRPATLARCIDTLSNYGSGREPCTAKAFSPRLGVLSGFVFQRRSPGDTTLSERGQSDSVL